MTIDKTNMTNIMDTHAVIKTLQKEYELSVKTAEGMVYAIQQGKPSSDMATKDDIKGMATKSDITRLETKMATKDDIGKLEKAMIKMELRLLVKISIFCSIFISIAVAIGNFVL